MGFHRRILKNHVALRYAMNLWPPFVGAGICVDEISKDFRKVRVRLKDLRINRNYVGTHFGGSLFAMTDPYFMIMVLHNLGSKYHVWDKHAQIEFIKPGRGTLRADLLITEEELEEIKKATALGQKYERLFQVEVKDEKEQLICRVQKLIYARLKPKYRPAVNLKIVDNE
jgi:acyl-coenzyme A thioesterase PaaI-like protein